MISLVEQPLLGWAGRNAYLLAKDEQKQFDLYQMDLIWLLTKKSYTGLSQPSEMYYKRSKADNRSGKQIAEDLIKKLGGE